MLTRRLKILEIDVTTLLEGIVRAPHWSPHLRARGLPDDARVVSLHLDPHRPSILSVVIESESFPEVPKDEPTPWAHVDFETWVCEEHAKGMSSKIINT